MSHFKIKKPPLDEGKFRSDSAKYDYLNNANTPIFCFAHTKKGFRVCDCDKDEKVSLIEKLEQLSALNWNQIQLAGKLGTGSEKIALSSLREQLPTSFAETLTADIKDLLALRFHGLKPLVGFRSGRVLHVLFIDPKMIVYRH